MSGATERFLFPIVEPLPREMVSVSTIIVEGSLEMGTLVGLV